MCIEVLLDQPACVCLGTVEHAVDLLSVDYLSCRRESIDPVTRVPVPVRLGTHVKYPAHGGAGRPCLLLHR